jgi:hypothetical protein
MLSWYNYLHTSVSFLIAVPAIAAAYYIYLLSTLLRFQYLRIEGKKASNFCVPGSKE